MYFNRKRSKNFEINYKIVINVIDIYHPPVDQTDIGSISEIREEVKRDKKRFGENGLVCVAENMNMENYEKWEEFI